MKLTTPGKAGKNTFKLPARKLRKGKYKISVSATDAAGNRSAPLSGRLKVR